MSKGNTSSYDPVTTNALCSPFVLVFKSYFFFGVNHENVKALDVEILLKTGLFHPNNS